MHNVFPRNWRNWIQRKLNSSLVNRFSNPVFVYWEWITPQFLKGNKEICSLFAKAINCQAEATWSSLRLLAWLSHTLMNAAAQFQEVSRVVEQTDGNAPRESALSPCPQSGHRFNPLCQTANVLKLVKVDLHDNRSNSYPGEKAGNHLGLV